MMSAMLRSWSSALLALALVACTGSRRSQPPEDPSAPPTPQPPPSVADAGPRPVPAESPESDQPTTRGDRPFIEPAPPRDRPRVLAPVVDIASAQGKGGSSQWDASVTQLMLAAYDSDHSGFIDSIDEVDQIPCSVFVDMDDAIVRGRPGGSLRTTYGLAPDFLWVGDALGFDESMRKVVDQRAASCGVRSPSDDSDYEDESDRTRTLA